MTATPPFPAPVQGIVLAHFIVSDDVDRSRRFYTEVLGGQTVTTGEPSYVALANGWIIINRRRWPDRRQADRHPRGPARPESDQQLPQHPGGRHRGRVRGLERARGASS